tara:strand:- start:2 stop:109 length:108 start_codon:yes stop_codon:yes gene_type:complete
VCPELMDREVIKIDDDIILDSIITSLQHRTRKEEL